MNNQELIIKNQEWIGRIPSDWSLVKIKEHFVERNIKVDDVSFQPLSVSMGGIVDQMENVSKSDDSGNRKLVKKNDFVINSRSDRKGSSGISPRDGSVSLINIVLKPKNINPKYSEYLLKSYYFKEEFFRNGKGIHFDLWSTRYQLMKQILIPYPNIDEQTQIVDYLDKKTKKIDELVTKIGKKVELLKEQKTSLINEVVTKGINPNVEMKDSGVEWIGEIPSGWDFVKLKQLFYINKRISGELGHDVLSVTQKGLRVKDLENNEGQHSMDYSKYQLVFKDDFVMNHMDLLTGYVDLSKQPGVTSPDYRVFTKSGEKVHNQYYLFLFQLCYTQRIFYGLGRGVSNMGRWRLPSVEFLNMFLPLPSYPEQQQIVDCLDEQTQLIDKKITTEEKRIELLKEYRQSLVSEVVTGKKRVVH
jgi:type I restriction enzyme S subunit